ncbi:MAG: ECF-type sigma factor [Bryobacteraceae bacterium]
MGLAELDESLQHLEAHDARNSKVVELLFFGGLTYDETAAALSFPSLCCSRSDRTRLRCWDRLTSGRETRIRRMFNQFAGLIRIGVGAINVGNQKVAVRQNRKVEGCRRNLVDRVVGGRGGVKCIILPVIGKARSSNDQSLSWGCQPACAARYSRSAGAKSAASCRFCCASRSEIT